MRNESMRQRTSCARSDWAFALLYPRLRELPRAQWADTLRRARDTEFDHLERAAIVVGICLAAWLLQHVGVDSDNAFVTSLLQFALAVPLLACLVGPMRLRRTRRGLNLELAKLEGGVKWHDPSTLGKLRRG